MDPLGFGGIYSLDDIPQPSQLPTVTAAPPQEEGGQKVLDFIKAQTAFEFADAKKKMPKYRFSSEFFPIKHLSQKSTPDDATLSPDDATLFRHSEAHYTKIGHQIAVEFFSKNNLQQYAQVMKDRAKQLLKDRPNVDEAVHEYLFQTFCDILFGEQVPHFTRDFNSLEGRKKISKLATLFFPKSDPSKICKFLDDARLSNEQLNNFVEVMCFEAIETAREALRNQILRYSEFPDLQETAFKTINEEEYLNDSILKFIIEEHRFRPISPTTDRRGIYVIDIEKFSREEAIVGPNPDKFDPNRWKKLPSDLHGLPWMPFGGGAHKCPGMDLHIHLSTQFLTALIQDYHIKKNPNYSLTIKDPRYPDPFQRVLITSKQSPEITKALTHFL